MIQGTKRVQTELTNTKFVGFTEVTVKAINPTRKELNKLLGKEDADDDKELDYMSEDKEGNKKVRLTFWLHSTDLNKYFAHSINLTKKVRVNNNGDKTQFINSVCITGWAEDENKLASWFTLFTDKNKEETGTKQFRPALVGEEELGTLLRSWLKFNWNDPETAVMVNTDSLFDENFKELTSLIDTDSVGSFIVLSGVRTDESDKTKQYQQIYGKAFLPSNFMDGIRQDLSFKSDYAKKVWAKFQEGVEGDYGFSSYFELVPIKEYNPEDDPAQVEQEPVDVAATGPKY